MYSTVLRWNKFKFKLCFEHFGTKAISWGNVLTSLRSGMPKILTADPTIIDPTEITPGASFPHWD